MATTPTDPKLENIRQDDQDSYAELLRLIDGPITALDPEKLYIPSGENEWSIMQILAHIVEIMPYWAGDLEKLVAAPGQNFGRTMQHAGRLQAIDEHGRKSMNEGKPALPARYAGLEDVVSTL